MIIQDDRTPEQKNTHRYLVIMTDKFLSGKLCSGKSIAAWAVDSNNTTAQRDCLCWVERRSDASRVRTNFEPYRPRNAGHYHVYIWKGQD